MNHRISCVLFATALGALMTLGGVTGCSDSTNPGQPQYGTLRMNLVDAPADLQGVESLVVIFSRVIVHRSAEADSAHEGWFTILADTLPEDERTFDLLQLVNGVFATLGEVELEAGHYTQVRIMLERAVLTVDGVVQSLFIPSGDETGIKLVGGFSVAPDVVTDLTVDFDVARSLIEAPPGSGNYILRPTIRLVQSALAGAIAGTVTPLGIGAVISALDPVSGETVATTLVDPTTGGYLLPALPAGTYDVLAEAPGYADGLVAGVVVAAGQETAGVDFELAPDSG